MRIPIACTLTADGAVDRIEEWRAFLATSTGTVERSNAQQLRIRLIASAGVLDRAVDLAQREKECCAFFDFAVAREAEAFWLRVRVPPEASGTLDDFASLLPRPPTATLGCQPVKATDQPDAR